MLIEEARWLGRVIAELDGTEAFPMLNIGSSTEQFRTVDQPWIDRYIFEPARERSQVVYHLDQKDAPGVDLVGDLFDPRLPAKLAGIEIHSVLCSNLLEHVPDRNAVCRLITQLVPPGGYVFVSCPYRFPYHPDPIDTRFRPTVAELAALFPGTEIVQGAIVSGQTGLDSINRGPRYLAKLMLRMLVPVYKPRSWIGNLYLSGWLFREFEATCVALRKETDRD